MKRNLTIVLLALIQLVTLHAVAQPKREMRGAWVTTVWAIDWPKNSWGSAANERQQKQEMVNILDSLQAARMNAAFLQVRGFSDAMYNSAYEPWSTYLTGTRGGQPTYDPLAFAIEQAHQRGIELHVWINPYRYSSSEATYGNLPGDYANTHSDWIIRSDAYTTILNPGLPAVRKRLCEVVGDIMSKYDIDGVIFDDYFYHNVPLSEDRALWQSTGTTLNQNDWRREQIHEMVRMVHDTIKAAKPWVTFGIGPAPQTCSNSITAGKYGVDVMPFSDWQYTSEWSEPIQWYYEGTVDYISPQIYYTIGSKNDYEGFCQWWSKTSNKFGRHFYASESLSGIGTSFQSSEIGNQMQMDRDYDKNDAPGHIWYGLMTGISHHGFIRYIRNNVNPYPALPPQMQWHERLASTPIISGMQVSGGRLTWVTPRSNLRYAVYCVPNDSIGQPGIFASGKYLLGMAYTGSFTIPAGTSGKYAVAAVDRYGNEYPVFIFGRNTMATNTAPTLTFPQDGGAMLMPGYFTWNAVPGADSYFFQLSKTADFAKVLYQHETVAPSFFSGNITWLDNNTTYYWRVVSRMPNADDAVSSVYSFSGSYFKMQAPVNGSRDVELTPTLVCDSTNDATASYLFELATSGTFAQGTVIYSGTSSQPRIQVPAGLLTESATYYVRATLTTSSLKAVSDAISFHTVAMQVPVPVIVSPSEGDIVYATELEVCWQEQPSLGFRVEMSSSTGFEARLTKVSNIEAGTYCYTYKSVKPGTYYLRVKAIADEAYTDPSPVVSIEVRKPTALDDVDADSKAVKTIENGRIVILRDGVRYDIFGQKIDNNQ